MVNYGHFELYSITILRSRMEPKFSQIRIIDTNSKNRDAGTVIFKNDGVEPRKDEPLLLCGPPRPPSSVGEKYIKIDPDSRLWCDSLTFMGYGCIRVCDVYHYHCDTHALVCGEWIENSAVGSFEFSFAGEKRISQVKGEIYVMNKLSSKPEVVVYIACEDPDVKSSLEKAGEELTKRLMLQTDKSKALSDWGSIPLSRSVFAFHRGGTFEIGCNLTCEGPNGEIVSTVNKKLLINVPDGEDILEGSNACPFNIYIDCECGLKLEIIWATDFTDDFIGCDKFFPEPCHAKHERA